MEVVRDGEVREIEVALLEPSPPSVNFFSAGTEEEVAELARSISESGLINPLTVRPMPGGVYQVLSGHRRLRAVQLLGWERVRCQVLDLPDEEASLVVIEANFCTRQLNRLEVAECVRRRVRLKQAIKARERELALKRSRFERRLEEGQVEVGIPMEKCGQAGDGSLRIRNDLFEVEMGDVKQGGRAPDGSFVITNDLPGRVTGGVVAEVAREMDMSKVDVSYNLRIASYLASCWREPFARGDLAFRAAYELAMLPEEEQEAAYRGWVEGQGRVPTLGEVREYRERCERARRAELSPSEMREQELREELERLRGEYRQVRDDLERARAAREIAEQRARYLEGQVAPPEELEKRWREEIKEDVSRRYERKAGEVQGRAERFEARVRELEMENKNLRSLIETLKVQEARVFARQVEDLERRKEELEAQVVSAEWALKEAKDAGDMGLVQGLRFYRVLEEASRPLVRALPDLEVLAKGARVPEAYGKAVLGVVGKLSRVVRLASSLEAEKSFGKGVDVLPAPVVS